MSLTQGLAQVSQCGELVPALWWSEADHVSLVNSALLHGVLGITLSLEGLEATCLLMGEALFLSYWNL